METIKPTRLTNKLGQHGRLIVSGFAIGTASLIPGVSGGTMALLLGVYQDLIDAIRAVSDAQVLKSLARLKVKQAWSFLPWQFLLTLGGGAILAWLTLPHFLERLFGSYPIQVEAFLFGLVAASIWAVGRRVERWTVLALVGMAVGAIGTYMLVGLMPAQTPNAPWLLFLGATIAICAMVLPGISGAYVLILMGQYQYALAAVTNRDLLRIGLIILGAGIGLVTFARALSWLFKKQYNLTLAVLAGMVAGSLRKLWPWKETSVDVLDQAVSQINVLPSVWSDQVAAAIGLAAVGFVLVLAVDRK